MSEQSLLLLFHLLRFIEELRKRYDWSEQDLNDEWDAAKSNPNAIWAKDEYGVDTCSLLRISTAGSSRALQHQKAVSRSHQAADDALEDQFTGFLHVISFKGSHGFYLFALSPYGATSVSMKCSLQTSPKARCRTASFTTTQGYSIRPVGTSSMLSVVSLPLLGENINYQMVKFKMVI